jgi:hypothetical protein
MQRVTCDGGRQAGGWQETFGPVIKGPGPPGTSCCAPPGVRADTTVIAANVAYPADVGLLAKAVAKLVRTVRRVQAAGGATGTPTVPATSPIKGSGPATQSHS